MEDKQMIADKLCEVLKLTDKYSKIGCILVVTQKTATESGYLTDEFAEIYLAGREKPYKRIDITADSGIAMLYDIVMKL